MGDWNREEEGDTRGRDQESRIRGKIAKTEFYSSSFNLLHDLISSICNE